MILWNIWRVNESKVHYFLAKHNFAFCVWFRQEFRTKTQTTFFCCPDLESHYLKFKADTVSLRKKLLLHLVKMLMFRWNYVYSLFNPETCNHFLITFTFNWIFDYWCCCFGGTNFAFGSEYPEKISIHWTITYCEKNVSLLVSGLCKTNLNRSRYRY